MIGGFDFLRHLEGGLRRPHGRWREWDEDKVNESRSDSVALGEAGSRNWRYFAGLVETLNFRYSEANSSWGGDSREWLGCDF